MPTQTRLTRTISLLYQYQDADVTALANDLLEQRKRAWLQALRDVGREHGVTVPPRPPSGDDLRELRRLAQEDARSIAKTWNRQVAAEIQRIYDANPRSNRFAYTRQLERWAEERGKYKNVQIALQSELTTREYARDQFYRNNALRGGLYVFSGGAPTCKQCVRLFGMGIVDQRVRDRYGDSQHISCPHYWQRLNPEQIGNDGAWMG
jgi:hypothetical protein